MDGKAVLRSAAPLALLLALALTASEVPLPASALGLALVREGRYAYQEVSSVLPEGIDVLRAAAPADSGALLAGRSGSGQPFLAAFNASRPDGEPSWVPLPSHYGDVRSLARIGNRHLLGGESVGPSPVLGVYDPGTGDLTDLSSLLPAEVTSVEQAVGRPTASGVVVLRDASGVVPALVDPEAPSLQVREPPGFENLSAVADALWAGAAYYVAGSTREGDPSLLRWEPGTDAVVDLGPQVAEEIDRIDRLVWNGTALFVLGADAGPFPSRGGVLSLDPETGSLDRVGEDVFRPFDRMEASAWNGTALLVVGRQGASRQLAIYVPATGAAFAPDDAVPPQWGYLAMVPLGDVVLLAGNYGGPALGLLHAPSGSFLDRTRDLERGYRIVADGAAWGRDFAVAGLRTTSPALGLLRTEAPRLEDRSGSLGLEDTMFLGATATADGLLLTGTNGTAASLYLYDADQGRLTNLTGEVPPEVAYLASTASNGTVALALGEQAGRPFLLQVDSGGGVRNRSADLGWYFTSVWHVVPMEAAFLLLGRNDEGPALATFHPGNGSLVYHGRSLSRSLDPAATLQAGGANEAGVLLGGSANGEPWLGLWTPETNRLLDASSRLPDPWTHVTAVAPLGRDFLVGGLGGDGATLGIHHPANGTHTDLSGLLPPSYNGVLALVPGQEATLVVGWSGPLRPAAGLLAVESGDGMGDNLLRDLGSNPLLAAVMGLSAALAAVLGYLLGRRRSPPAAPRDPYYEGPGPGEF